MPHKHDSYDDRQANAILLTCTRCGKSRYYVVRKRTCADCGKHALVKRRDEAK